MQRYTVYLFLETALHVSGGISTQSSGAHTTVSTASGTCQTVMDTNKLLMKCMGVSKDTPIHFISNLFVSITV